MLQAGISFLNKQNQKVKFFNSTQNYMYYLFNVKIKIQINAVVHDLIQQCLRNKTLICCL